MNSLKYIIFVVSYALYLLFGVLLISELIFDPDIVGIVLMLALTSGAFTIQKRFKAESFSRKEKKVQRLFQKAGGPLQSFYIPDR